MIKQCQQVQSDERILRAGTTLRFALLVVLLVLSSGSMMLDVVGGLLDEDGEVRCVLAAGADPNWDFRNIWSVVGDQEDAFDACLARSSTRLSLWWGIVWPSSVVAGAAGLFFGSAAWKARRSRVVLLSSLDRDGELQRVLDNLARTSGLTVSPRFMVDPTAASPGAVVFGRNRRPTVCLHGGLLAVRRTEPYRFNAVVLHELAHIHNRDVTITYLTVSVWRAFVLTVLVPYVAWCIYALANKSLGSPQALNDDPFFTSALLLSLCLVVLVYLARSDVLRNREVCADLMAARWGADPRGWVFTAPSASDDLFRRYLGSFLQLWRAHPRWATRQDALVEASELFRVHALPMFLIGIAATLINHQPWSYLRSLDEAVYARVWIVHVIALISAGLVTAVVGVTLFRSVVYSLLTSRSVPSGLSAGSALGCGMAVAELLLPDSLARQWIPEWSAALLIPVLAGLFFATWLSQCAQLWVRTWPGRSTLPSMWLVLFAATVVLAAWFVWWDLTGRFQTSWSMIRDFDLLDGLYRSFVPLDGHAVEQSMVRALYELWVLSFGLPIGPIAVTTVWVVPLLAWCVRPATILPRWARTSRAGSTRLPVVEPIPRLSPVLVPGLWGGIFASAGMMIIQAYMHTWKPPAGDDPGWYELIFQQWLIVAVLAGTVVAAIGASLRSGPVPLIRALIASQVAFVCGCGGVFVLVSVDGCLGPLNALSAPCRWEPQRPWLLFSNLLAPIAMVGMVLASLATLVVVILRGLSGLARKTPTQKISHHSSQRGLVRRRAFICTICAITLLFTVVVTAREDSLQQHPQEPIRVQTDIGSLSVSADLRADQVAAWYDRGGGRILKDVVFRSEDFFAASKADSPDAVAVLAACTEFDRLAQEMNSYFRVPDPTGQSIWRLATMQLERGSTKCSHAIRGLESAPGELTEDDTASLNAQFAQAYDDIGTATQNLLNFARYLLSCCTDM